MLSSVESVGVSLVIASLQHLKFYFFEEVVLLKFFRLSWLNVELVWHCFVL